MFSKISSQKRYLKIRNVTYIAIITNIALSFIKITFGIVGQSHALVADGIHSFTDLTTDIMIIIGVQFSTQAPDFEYPYGYARFETATTIFIGITLLVISAGLLIDAQMRLLQPELLLHPTMLTVVAAGLSVIAKEALYYHTIHVANKIHSPMLRANAWHHRSDAISSAIVFFSLIGTMLGILWLDAAATIAISLIIAYIGVSIMLPGIKQFLGIGLTIEEVAEIKTIINSTAGVLNSHQLRTRKMGANILLDVHIEVAPFISVSEGHKISKAVRKNLMAEIGEITDILVHVNLENDKINQTRDTLPTRSEIMNRLKLKLEYLGISNLVQKVTLHYVAGKLTIDIDLPLDMLKNNAEAQNLSLAVSQLANNDPDIYTIQLYFHPVVKSNQIVNAKIF
ncbi:MAG: cation transporter [Thiomargarita sp.]|nr:cation transporter [Thiomargarita sp.]